jgi:mono/diheme cytochrome c family protein
MRGFLGGIVFTIVVALVAVVVAVKFGLVPANADRGPLPMERMAARMSLNATIHREMPQQAPFQATPADLDTGAVLYVQNCAVCHGSAHSNPTAVADGLYIAAPQFGKHDVADDPVGETYWKIHHGVAWTAMPAFDRTLDDRAQWQISWFLKNLPEVSGRAKAVWENPALAPAPTPAPLPSGVPQPPATH